MREPDLDHARHYKWDEKGKMICDYLKQECPVNDTVAGSTCPMCVYNPTSESRFLIIQ